VIPLPIGIVFDDSTIRRFQAAEDLAVGELIGEVVDNASFVAIPVTAVADCHRRTSDENALAMLAVLIAPGREVVISPLLVDDGVDVGTIARSLGCDLPLAHAVHLAQTTHAQLATAHGDKVRAVFGDLFGIVDL
jgi:hypothetical protein